MAQIEARQKRMYWAPTRRRHYATLKQACRAEASAIITRAWVDGGGDGLWLEHEEEAQRIGPMASEIERNFRAKAPS